MKQPNDPADRWAASFVEQVSNLLSSQGQVENLPHGHQIFFGIRMA